MSKRFLIGQLACFGDCLYVTALAKQIKHDYPDSHLTWAVASKYKSILELNPDVDEIWEIPVPDGDYYGASWHEFVQEAQQRQTRGEFDEIILSQLLPHNLLNYRGTLRQSVLSAYGRPITVSVAPVLRLSDAEVQKVKLFAAQHQLADFREVILFECAPASGQSQMTVDMALAIAQTIAATRSDICFILSTPDKLPVSHPQIIDASALSFRENAELTHYCTLLVGCSSGLTWLATSDWAKPLPMLQLLNKDYSFFAGVHYDLGLNGLDNQHIIEMTDFDLARVIACLESLFELGPAQTAADFHQIYAPSYVNLRQVLEAVLWRKPGIRQAWRFVKRYAAEHESLRREMSARRYLALFGYIAYHQLRYSDNSLLKSLKKTLKRGPGNDLRGDLESASGLNRR